MGRGRLPHPRGHTQQGRETDNIGDSHKQTNLGTEECMQFVISHVAENVQTEKFSLIRKQIKI